MPATVVGVMPEGFRFPVSHDAWIPFRLNLSEFKGRQGPEIHVFGRLASGVGLDKAQAELTTIGLRLAAEFPDTHAYLRPEVLPYAQSITDIRGLEAAALLSINVFLIMLLVLVCGNVALLMFARAATRESEIVVRTALGAGRGRIIGQLFAEALVLAGVAAPVGLAAAGFLLRWWLTVAEIDAGGRLPFWFSDSLAPSTVAYAVGLTLVAAIVSGVVPALKVTGRVSRSASASGGRGRGRAAVRRRLDRCYRRPGRRYAGLPGCRLFGAAGRRCTCRTSTPGSPQPSISPRGWRWTLRNGRARRELRAVGIPHTRPIDVRGNRAAPGR